VEDPAARDPFRWVVFSAMAAVYFSFGLMTMSIPPMVDEVRTDLGISRGAMGFALGAWALIYVVTAPPAGRVVDRIGLRWSLLLGGICIAASGLARAAAQGLGTLWLGIAIFGIGGPLVSASVPKLVSVWFGDAEERRLAVGVYNAAPAAGVATALVLTNTVLLPVLDSWRAVLVVDAGVAVVAALVWWAVSSRVDEPDGGPAPAGVVVEPSWRRLVESSGVRYALVLGLGGFFLNHGLNAWLPNVLEVDSGFSAAAASNWVAASIAVGVLGGLVAPRYADERRHPRILAAVLVVIVVSLVTIAVAPDALDAAATLTLGLRATLVPLTILVLMDADGVSAMNLGTANGLWFAVAEIGGTLGPLVVGTISDTSAGFTGSLLVLAAVALALLAVVARRARDATGAPTRTARPAAAVRQ
jgi:MFS transporter, CP family, cyanate transporter